MRFYIIDKNEHKIYILVNNHIKIRDDLSYYYNLNCERCREYINFSKNDIVAEESNGDSSVFICAILGCFMFSLLLDAIGAIIGIMFGIMIGLYIISKEKYNVKIFNKSEG